MRPDPRLICVVLAALLLGGCTYTVDVHNATDVPVLVQLVQEQWPNPQWVMDSHRLDPGANARLGPARVSGGRVLIEAGERTRTDEPARLRVGSGRTAVRVATHADGRSLTVERAKPGEVKGDAR
ncbi:MAG: hypothetical protein ACKVU4_05005 [Phycisphaerales bacterium]